MNKFTHIKDPILRTWNRLNVLYNMKGSLGNTFVQKYAKSLGKDGMRALLTMHQQVKDIGYEQVRRDIMRNMA